jgi:hypothetical protein
LHEWPLLKHTTDWQRGIQKQQACPTFEACSSRKPFFWQLPACLAT